MKNPRKNRLIFLGSLSAVFVCTMAYGYGPGYGNNLLGVLGIHIGSSSIQSPMSPKMSPGDMVTSVVTSKKMVTPKSVTNVTTLSPLISSIILSNQSNPSNPSVSPSVTLTVSPSLSRTPSRTPSVSPTPASYPTPVIPTVTIIPTVYYLPSPSPSTSSVSATENPTSSASPINPIMTTGNVIISEIGWMGTNSSATDEWFELYNADSNSVNLDGWHLQSSDNSPNIILNGIIISHGYYIIERTNDTTISDVPAQLVTSFGKGGLSNSGENLILTDADGEIRDNVSASEGWFAGDNTDKTSMERVGPDTDGNQVSSWKSNNQILKNGHDSADGPINGTPGSANSMGGF